MINKISSQELSQYSLWFLFNAYKVDKDDRILCEIFNRTYSDIYDLLNAKIGYRDKPTRLVQMVYTSLKELLDNGALEDVDNYLELVVDDCLKVFSN